MYPILNVGPLAIQMPGLLIILGVYITVLIVEKQSKRFSLDSNIVSNLIFIFLISTILLSRFAYVARFPSIFIENPLSIFSFNLSMFDIPSGLILSLLTAYIYIQKKKIAITNLLDSLSLPLLIFLLFLFLSFFASGNFYGKPSELPWTINLWGTKRHPLQLYYMIGLIPIIFSIITLAKKNLLSGLLFAKTIFYLALLFVFLDFFNGSPWNKVNNFNLIQIIAFIIMIASFWIYYKVSSTKKDIFLITSINQ